MSLGQNTFEDKLKLDYPQLVSKMEAKKYILLIPNKRLITDTSILTKRLYYNHIYYVDKYNDHLYINLNGKVLKYDHPKFTTYLGWPKDMVFTVLDSFNSASNYLCYQLDNICDEIHYREGKSVSKDNKLKKFDTKIEYLRYYNNYVYINDNYKKSIERLEKFVNEMKVNYILLKGQEEKYSKIFRDRTVKLINRIRDNISSPKDENMLVYDISAELADSLIFHEIYSFLFEKLQKFYEKEENEIKKILAERPIKYEWEGLKIDEIFFSCKFSNAIKRLDDISLFTTVFEKVKVLVDVNSLITEEARNAYDSANRGDFIPQGDLLLSFWIYVVAHCKTKNIIAESKFLSLFGIKGNSEDDYVKTTFISAVDAILIELLEKENFSQHLEPNIINFSYPSSLSKDKKNKNF